MNKAIQKITILPGVDKSGHKEKFEKIEVKKGETVAIVGGTGAGKSQLLYDIEKIAQGDTKSKRRVLINEKAPDSEWRFDPKRKLVASLAQTMNFLTDMKVGDFLRLHLEARGKKVDPKLIEEVIEEANEITGEPISLKMNLLHLSGGQSRALMVSDIANISVSPVILIDEIENAGIRKEKAIHVLIEEGKIVLIVTHDPALALKSDKRVIIKNGGIVDVLETTQEEKEIADHLNQEATCHLDIRERIRRGEEVKKSQFACRLVNRCVR